MKHINKASGINVSPSPFLNPSSCGMSIPQRLTLDRLPHPWLLDSESLISELARVRELALRIPPVRKTISSDQATPLIDALWDPEERLRYLSLRPTCLCTIT